MSVHIFGTQKRGTGYTKPQYPPEAECPGYKQNTSYLLLFLRIPPYPLIINELEKKVTEKRFHRTFGKTKRPVKKQEKNVFRLDYSIQNAV